jgi:hypothetical protein
MHRSFGQVHSSKKKKIWPVSRREALCTWIDTHRKCSLAEYTFIEHRINRPFSPTRPRWTGISKGTTSPASHPVGQFSPSSSPRPNAALTLGRYHTFSTENRDTTTGSHQVHHRDRDRADPESSFGRGGVADNLEDSRVSRSGLWRSLSLRSPLP